MNYEVRIEEGQRTPGPWQWSAKHGGCTGVFWANATCSAGWPAVALVADRWSVLRWDPRRGWIDTGEKINPCTAADAEEAR